MSSLNSLAKSADIVGLEAEDKNMSYLWLMTKETVKSPGINTWGSMWRKAGQVDGRGKSWYAILLAYSKFCDTIFILGVNQLCRWSILYYCIK